MSDLADKRAFYIDGAWVAPSQPHDLEVIDPSTEEPIAVISLGTVLILSSLHFFFFCFLGLHPQHMEVPSLGVQSEL